MAAQAGHAAVRMLVEVTLGSVELKTSRVVLTPADRWFR